MVEFLWRRKLKWEISSYQNLEFWKILSRNKTFFCRTKFIFKCQSVVNLPKPSKSRSFLISHFNFNLFNFNPFLVNHLVPASEWDAIIFSAFLCIEPTDLRIQVGPYSPFLLTCLAPKWHENFLAFVFTLFSISSISYRYRLRDSKTKGPSSKGHGGSGQNSLGSIPWDI